MFKLLRNKKGLILVEVIFISLMITASGISLSNSVRHWKQDKRVFEICVFNGESNCDTKAAGMTREAILDYIADKSVDGTGFYAPKEVAKRSGGKLRARALAAQR